MPYSERIIGFSTGAIAKGDFRFALDVLKRARVSAIELSALREEELPDLSRSLRQLDLGPFEYVSVHAPARFVRFQEQEVVRLLEPVAALRRPIVVHPDTIKCPELWRGFGNMLLIENMDKRKPIGRTSEELATFFDSLPEAGFCFDVAHARQIDPTMMEAGQLLRTFGQRIQEVHASGVSTRSTHGPISAAASFAYSNIAALIPPSVPIILESPIQEDSILDEISFARNAFSPWLERLRSDIDDVFDLRIEALRRTQVENFLKSLQLTNIKLNDFESVVSQLPSGGGYGSGDVFLDARDLLNRLSESQRLQLREYLFDRIRRLALEFPDLKSAFRDQFADVS